MRQSSAITDVTYLEDEDGVRVVFSNGSAYVYPGVGNDLYLQMIAAPSLGKFFHEKLRGRPSYVE